MSEDEHIQELLEAAWKAGGTLEGSIERHKQKLRERWNAQATTAQADTAHFDRVGQRSVR